MIARVNGYSKSLIQNLINKHKRKMHVADLTTLEPIADKKVRMKLTYYPPITNKLTEVLRSADIEPAFASVNKIKDRLCNNKDRIEKSHKSGIYQIKCESCDDLYVGQCRRAVYKRWKEHNCDVRNMNLENAVALHYDQNKTHKFNAEKCSKLIKIVSNELYLDAWESMYMKKFADHLMNVRPPPLDSCLFEFCT